MMTKKNAARLNWCNEMRSSEDFDKVIFTDETGYWLHDEKGKG